MTARRLAARSAQVVALAAATLLCACSDDETTAPPPPAPTLVFEADEASASPAVSLRQQQLDAQTLVLELVGHDLDDVYGVAFRLELDPAVLGWTGLQASDRWSGNALAVGRQVAPGLVVGAVTERGLQAQAISADGDALAQIELSIEASAAGRVDFGSDDCAVVGADGAEHEQVTWYGGQLVWR